MSILGFIWRGVKRFGSDLAVALPSEIISHKIVHRDDHIDDDGKAQSGAEKIAKYVVRRTFTDSRAILLNFILQEVFAEDETASNNLLEWHEKRTKCLPPYKPNDENRFVKLLTKLYNALESSPHDRLKTFVTLGRMTENEFNLKLDFLENDVVAQWLKRIGIFSGKTDDAIAAQLTRVVTWLDANGVK